MKQSPAYALGDVQSDAGEMKQLLAAVSRLLNDVPLDRYAPYPHQRRQINRGLALLQVACERSEALVLATSN